MGNAGEWLPEHRLGQERFASADAHMQAVLAKGMTANNRFGVKIFPNHMLNLQRRLGYDFVSKCRQDHDTKIIYIERRDRLGQAISYARAKMTSSWKAAEKSKREVEYDFGKICASYFHLERHYAFWRAYLAMSNIAFDHFFYEDLVDDPSPYLTTLARHLEVEPSQSTSTDMKVQRDQISMEWRERFLRDAAGKNLLAHADTSDIPARNLGNLLRFLQRKSLNG